ncbi:MAG: thiamine-phosphate kinase [Actinomycetales bacterium]|nr:thiamine-phosphate kinase [Actinomycetales bacterium]
MKLRDIVVPMLAADRNQVISLGNGCVASLLLGAESQDDCAAYAISSEVVLVACSDYIRGVGFHLFEKHHLTEYDLGWYLAGANLSDVAAMGAQPLALLSVVRYPKDLPDSSFESLLRGVSEACREVGAINVGGDIGTADNVVLSASAFGLVEPGALLSRSGAAPGDLLVITGLTGEAGAAMKLSRGDLLDEIEAPDREHLLSRWRRVTPRVRQGRAFAASGSVSSCMDTSDGLKTAVETLARSSGAKFVVEGARLPISEPVRRAADVLKVSPESLVFGDSVDFELLATVRPSGLATLIELFQRSGMPLYVIGRVERGEGAFFQVNSAETEIPGVAWRH